MFVHHYESSALVRTTPTELFSHVDDPLRLSSHMSKSSWMMAGTRMQIEIDCEGGRKVGSRIRMIGRILGVRLALEEAITERDPPHRKAWQTIGEPRLLVIGRYRMGFDIAPQRDGSVFRVFIDYDLPNAVPARWLGFLFGQYYARWCTQRMVTDAVARFAPVRH